MAKYSNTAALMLLLTRLPTGPVVIAGSPEQRRRYVRPVAEGTPHDLMTGTYDSYVQELMQTPRRQAERLSHLMARGTSP